MVLVGGRRAPRHGPRHGGIRHCGRSLQELRTLAEYSQPLLELLGALPQGEKVLLVGHSLGGMNISLAMEMFPNKISVAVFLTALMPDTTHVPSYVIDQYVERRPAEDWQDTEFLSYGSPQENLSSLNFGPNYIASQLYQLSSPEDFELAKMLVRPSSLFLEDLSKMSPFTEEGYGSVKKVYVMCREDKAIPEIFQRWLIELSEVDGDEVKILDNTDHMAMISSNPHGVYQYLLEIANTCAN